MFDVAFVFDVALVDFVYSFVLVIINECILIL